MELLHGKAKEAFLKQSKYNEYVFNELRVLYKNSLVIEWLDSVGIICIVGYNSLIKKYYWNIDKTVYETKPVQTRQEATTEAIKKAVDIYNEKHI